MIVLLLVGCSDVADVANLLLVTEEPTPLIVNVVPTPSVVFPPEATAATRIQSRGRIVVGIRYDLEPFSYIDASGQLAGLEIDLARELARRWLGNPDAVEFRQVRSDTAIQHLTDGTIDIALAGVPHTQEAEADADFSPPYFMNGQALLTFPDTHIQSLADLQGRTVGTLDWTESQAALKAATQLSVTYTSHDTFFDVLEALRVRQMDAYADQRHRLERARRLVAGTTVVAQYTWEPVALVYRSDDPFFDDLVTLTFQDMVHDGTRDTLYARWLPGTSPPSISLWPGSASTPALSASPPQRSTLDVRARIRERGTLAVGYYTNRWPYSAQRNDGVPTGFEVRLLERVAERWLGSRQAVTYVPLTDTVVTEEMALTQLEQGKIDILIGNWMPSREIALRANFSIPIFDDGVSLLSTGTAPVQQISELGGRPVAVVAGTAGESALPGLIQTAGMGIASTTYPDFDSALTALWNGEVGALLMERRRLLYVFYNQVGFFLADQRYTSRPLVYVLPQGDSRFRDMMNLTLATFQATGVYQELYPVWFDDPVPTLETRPGIATIPLSIDLAP
ncbi:MAG: transporter substrate-binding domain-containing protein [Anaerolineae bacterium]|nr:transporter substrate-binding domain-containing protein [Anaerolineae bacterium]